MRLQFPAESGQLLLRNDTQRRSGEAAAVDARRPATVPDPGGDKEAVREREGEGKAPLAQVCRADVLQQFK